jgi:ribosomal protein L16 Arg81 hydroxylase
VLSAPLSEIDLEPGDLLYLPGGFVHTTETSDSFSVHVTLGITVYTWIELLTEWAQLSTHCPSFRRALPPGFAGRADVRQSLGNQLRRMSAELQAITDYDAFVLGFSQRLRSARNGLRSGFSTDVTATEPGGQRSSGQCSNSD